MSTILSKLVKLTPAHWWGLSVASLYLLLAGWRLFVLKHNLDRWAVTGSRHRVSRPVTETERAAFARRARWVNAVARHPLPWARCLQRSLALCLWLEREGFQPQLRIGVRKEGVALEAHAWVEYSGEVLNDTQDVSQEFAPLTGSSIGLPESSWERDGS